MRVRNNYGLVPKGENGYHLTKWWTVEEEPGIAVSGDDYEFNFESEAEAEQAAENLAALTDAKLTVVENNRIERSSFRRKTIVEREG